MKTVCARVAIVLSLVVALAVPAWAGPATDDLRRNVDRMFAVLGAPDMKDRPAERHRLVRALAEETLDFREAAHRALGNHWDARTPDERAHFVELFTMLIDHGYLSRLEGYDGETLRYDTETITTDQAMVKARVVGKDGSDVMPVQFLMSQGGDRWRVYDVSVGGMSLMGSYRAQFSKLLRTGTYEELVARLEAKVGTPRTATAAAP